MDQVWTLLRAKNQVMVEERDVFSSSLRSNGASEQLWSALSVVGVVPTTDGFFVRLALATTYTTCVITRDARLEATVSPVISKFSARRNISRDRTARHVDTNKGVSQRIINLNSVLVQVTQLKENRCQTVKSMGRFPRAFKNSKYPSVCAVRAKRAGEIGDCGS